MREAHFSELIRPVHPEYYVREESPESTREESAFTHTLMRVDPLLELWRKQSPRRDDLVQITEIEPRDATSWRDFIGKLFDLAAQKKAVGIKQLQAYFRRLEYLPRKDSEVVWMGDLRPDEIVVFQDWVMHECCKQANDRNWAHQVHVGTHNLGQSSPLPLELLAKRYPRMKIVMIHCWPFLNEAGYLAKSHPNLYIDTGWQLILNPTFFREAMRLWLNYVPTHKITCSHDATSLEMAVGSSLFTREVLAEVLPERTQRLGVSNLDLKCAALDFLHNNCVEIYGIGEKVEI
jgi:predicted TIM-barrel fold metal-dependent hydrolase